MEVIAVNQKGGAGKTTTEKTVAIADQLASQVREAMLDLDPQGSLTAYFQLDPDAENTVTIFTDELSISPTGTGFDNLSLVPARVLCQP